MKHATYILIRDPEGYVLLLERSQSSKHFRGMWEFPGGKIDPGQTAAEAVRREAEEEAALQIPQLPEEPAKRILSEDGKIEFAFFCHDFTGQRPEVQLSSEHSEFRWAKPTELRRMADEGRIMAPHLAFFEWDWLRRQIEAYATGELPAYKSYAKTIETILHQLRKRWAPLAIVQARPKAVDSFAGKCLRKAGKYDDPTHDLTDLCGGRIIATTEREAELLCRQVRNSFEILEDENKAKMYARNSFGYLSVHFLVRIPRVKGGSERVKDLLGVPIPEEIGDRIAELQVRTLLQHAHAEVTHDRLYKSGFKAPEDSQREAARVAAALESADAEFGRFVERLDAYVGEYAAEMEPAERKRRIDDQHLLIDLEENPDKKAKLALVIAHLARSAWDWETITSALDCFAETRAPCRDAIRMELGHALCRLHYADTRHPEFERGVGLLESVANPDLSFDDFLEEDERIRRATALGWLGRAWSRARGQRKMARRCLQGAIRLAPKDPYHVCAMVEFEVVTNSEIKNLALLEPSLRAAADRCLEHIQAGIEVNRAWLALARIRLLLSEDEHAVDAIEALCQAARSTENPRPMADILGSLESIKDAIGKERPAAATLERAARLFLREAEFRQGEGERASWNWSGLEGLAEIDPSRQVLIIAGATGKIDDERLARYDAHLRAALDGCEAQFLSGGTTAGVCGLLAEIAGERAAGLPGSGRFLGYRSAKLPPGTEAAGDPVESVETPAATKFSVHEPLQMWTDLLVSGVDPERVVLLCLGGGKISSAELALAWALGAKAAVIDDGSDAARRFKNVLKWAGEESSGGMLVPDDVATVSAMLCFRSDDPDSAWAKEWEEPGKAVHEAYLRDQSRRAREPALLQWDLLPAGFKHSNRHQAFYAAGILRSHGFTVEKSDQDPEQIVVFEFTDDEKDQKLIESMAEAEHGRWNAERLHDGWQHGEPKDPDRKISPYLIPWADLPDDIKGYDLNAVRQWPEILARAGWEMIRPAQSPHES